MPYSDKVIDHFENPRNVGSFMSICIICKKEFIIEKYKKSRKTCDKLCKNKLASMITKKQFENLDAREHARKISLEQKNDIDYIEKFKKGIILRQKRWMDDNYHPRKDKKHSEKTKDKIRQANTGKNKGKSWEQIMGVDLANRRKKINSCHMAKTNEVLLKRRTSSIEKMIIPYLPDYLNNIKINNYVVDFINRNRMHIIEIYGDYWHCNPLIYNDDYIHPYLKILAKQKRISDYERIKNLENFGYYVSVIWEYDIKKFGAKVMADVAINEYHKKQIENNTYLPLLSIDNK